MKISTITQRKVGPYTVTVTRASEDNIVDTFGESSHRSNSVVLVLDDCEYDYRDPEMGTEDLLERLQDLMESRDDVRRYGYFQHNGGHGAVVTFEEG